MTYIILLAALMVAAKAYCYEQNACPPPQNCERLGADPSWGWSGGCYEPCTNNATGDAICDARWGTDLGIYFCDTVNNRTMCLYRECYNDADCPQYHICNTSIDIYYQCEDNGPPTCSSASECNSGEHCEGKWDPNAQGRCQPQCTNDQDCRDRCPSFFNDSNYKCDASMNNMCVYRGCLESDECTDQYNGFEYTCDTSLPYYYSCEQVMCYLHGDMDCDATSYCDYSGSMDPECRVKCTGFNDPDGHCELIMGYDGWFCDMSTGQCQENDIFPYFSTTTEEMTTTKEMTTTEEMGTTEEIKDVCEEDDGKNRCHGNASQCNKDKNYKNSKYDQILAFNDFNLDEWCVWCLCEDYWRCAYYALPAITEFVDDNDRWDSVKANFVDETITWFMETCFGHTDASECTFDQVELQEPVTGCNCETFICNGHYGKTETVNTGDVEKYAAFGTIIAVFVIVLCN